ncbi:MAG: PKD domain-containing protein [Acidobacteriota bacterium]
MKKNLVFLPLILLLVLTPLNSENINSSPNQVFPGTQVTFGIQGANNQAQFNYTWNFGDGSPPVSRNQSSVNHVYKEPGSYDVSCDRTNPNGQGQPHTMTYNLTVSERRTVSPSGSSFMAGNPVMFNTNHFVENTLNWDFDDGTKNNGQKNREHTYANPGNYTIKVKDYGGNSSSVITCTITIAPDNRSINYQPSSPMAGREVTFQAVNFSGNLKWDFGDGTIQNGGQSKKHTFSSQGNFKVKVTDLAIGPNSCIEETVNVAPDNRSINMNPQNPSLYEEVTFNAVNFSSGSIEWDFDRNNKKTGGQMEKHIFSNMGNFNIKAREAGTSSPYVTMMVSVNQDKRKIQIQPPSALIGKQVMIRLQNSTANMVTWKIGNNNPMNNSPLEIQHKFKDPGRVEIKAEIQGQTPLREFISINDNRELKAEKKYIFEKTEFKIKGRNLNSPSVKWDMGDGTVRTGGHQMSYTYMRPGNFTVRVFDFDGTSKTPVQLRINILRDNREVVSRKRTIIADTDAEFEARNFADNRVRWIMGDGADRRGSKRIEHKYKRPGTYRITAIDFDGKASRKIELSVNVVRDSRNFEFGKTIIAGVPFSMQMKNSQGGNFEWRLSDGRTISGQNPGEITFNSPGVKQIVITDKTGLYPPVTKSINVQSDTRSLVLGDETILKGEELKIFAKNFKGAAVKWNVGDGSPPKILSKSITQIYNKTGTYKITVTDYEGKGKKLFTKTVKVKEQMDDFRINAIELSFSNGKYYRIVPVKSFSPGYLVKLKINGKGIITGKWLFDGKVFGLFTKLLAGRSLITMKASELPKLPVLETGIHSLSFEFTNFNFEGKVPTLRYFVTNSGAIKTTTPLTGSKLTRTDVVKLKWRKKRRGDRFEIAVSETPFQLLSEKNIKWVETGEDTYFDLDTAKYNSGQWIYWQVRMVDATGTVSTVSEISFFKIL